MLASTAAWPKPAMCCLHLSREGVGAVKASFRILRPPLVEGRFVEAVWLRAGSAFSQDRSGLSHWHRKVVLHWGGLSSRICTFIYRHVYLCICMHACMHVCVLLIPTSSVQLQTAKVNRTKVEGAKLQKSWCFSPLKAQRALLGIRHSVPESEV